MDPSVAAREALDKSNAWQTRAAHARAFLGWVSGGGFFPSDLTRDEYAKIREIAGWGSPRANPIG
jgi:hypothetical protein